MNSAPNPKSAPQFRVAMAQNQDDVRLAQKLRYDVFVHELGGSGQHVDHDSGLERDPFDDVCSHMLLFDDATDRVVGVYRLLHSDQAHAIGRFYSETEFDLSRLKSSGRRLLELGRSCLAADYRGGPAMYHLWQALSAYVLENGIDVLFGVASFHGTETEKMAQPLSLLHHRHLAAEHLRPYAIGATATPMNILPESEVDRRAAMISIPALIKAYLRLGGVVGQGAWIDYEFNTTDVCLVLDTKAINPRQRQIYTTR